MGTILIATDGSQAAEAAAELGLDLALATHDDVIFIAVWDMIRTGVGAPWAYVDQRYVDADREHAAELLAAAKARAVKLGVGAETMLVLGDPVTEICKAASQCDARFIVLGAHGWGALQAFVHGSVAAGVLSHAPCPVLTGKPGIREMLETGAEELPSAERA